MEGWGQSPLGCGRSVKASLFVQHIDTLSACALAQTLGPSALIASGSGLSAHRGKRVPLVARPRDYRGSSLIRNHLPLGPCFRPMPRVLGGSQGGGSFLMSEVPL